MLPNDEQILQDVKTNFDKMFKGIKVSKKAKEKIEVLLKNAIINEYRVHAIKTFVGYIPTKELKNESQTNQA